MPHLSPRVDSGSFSNQSAGTVFFLSLLAVSLLNLPYLSMPPVWDVAASIFSPAIYLFENGFDFPALLTQSGYLAGGPNVHSFNLFSFISYGTITLTGGDPSLYLPALHILNFLFSALALTATFLLARHLMETVTAAIVTVALLLFPLFAVQSSYIYTEVPGAALVLLAIIAWSSRHLGRALLLVALACLVKSFGLALAAAFIGIMIFDGKMPLPRRWAWVFLYAVTVIGIEALKWSFATTPAFERISYHNYINSLLTYLSRMPDLRFLVIFSLIFPLLYFTTWNTFLPAQMLREISRLTQESFTTRAWTTISVFPIVFLAFVATVPLSGKNFFPLPRYYVWILPCLLLIFSLAIRELPFILQTRVFIHPNAIIKVLPAIALSFGTVFLAFNRHGDLYPYGGRAFYSFSVAERSFEYLDFFRIQRDGVKSVEKSHQGLPVFVTRGEYYFLSSPLMGYIDEKPRDVRFVLTPPYAEGNLNNFPDDFLLLDSHSNSYHGQHVIDGIYNQALTRSNYRINLIKRNMSGRYESSLYHIHTVDREPAVDNRSAGTKETVRESKIP